MGGVCLYISVDIDFKPRNDLKIYESKMIESLFIEIIYKNEYNAIVGVLYRVAAISSSSLQDSSFNDVT